MIQSLVLSVLTLFATQNAPVGPFGLDWKVGDNASYNLDLGGFIKGSMDMKVRELNDKGFWVDQDADLGFAGKQKIEILYDKNTGAPLEVIANGEKQALPDPSSTEIVTTKPDKVTVPAGTFEALYAQLKDTKSGDLTDAWINPELIPIGGMIKTIAPSQVGQMTLELKSYKKQ